MNKKPLIRFIVTYYGQWPNYLRMWCDSVAANPEVEVIFITDLPPQIWFPKNVQVHSCGLEEFMGRMESLLGQPLPRMRYHKLCDYRPLYALAFPELISHVPYWGYCDVDLVFGNLAPLLEAVRGGEHDILSPFSCTVGHCTVIRNHERTNGIGLKINQLVPRLHQPNSTFMDEGSLSETALKLGGFKFYVVDVLAEEWKLSAPFLGATIQPSGTLAGLESNNWLIQCEPGRTIVYTPDHRAHEVLYVHFMAMKQMRFWKPALREHLTRYTVTPHGIAPGHLPPETMHSLGYRFRSVAFQAGPKTYALARKWLPKQVVDTATRFYKSLRPLRR